MKIKVMSLLIYKSILQDDVIQLFCKFLKHENEEESLQYVYEIQRRIIDKSEYDILGWKSYILKIIICDENIFSLNCENDKTIHKKLYSLVAEDIKILRQVYLYDWSRMVDKIQSETILNYESCKDPFERLGDLLDDENISNEEIVDKLMDHFKKNGVGTLASKYVFKWEKGLVPVVDFDDITFKNLIGYERQIEALKNNTLAFMTRGKGNNVLLYGDRGTGKSSSVKALIHDYGYQGLRMIEIKKSQMVFVPKIIEKTRNRNFKFIIFIDDLSFEEFETDYKAFKGILEGSFERKPQNVLIYVTSNRKHLIRENFKEREEDVHGKESMQEKLSLFDRFGVSILYGQPEDDLYYDMVIQLARKNGISIPQEELLSIANEWKVVRSSRSGRTAQQLIDTLL